MGVQGGPREEDRGRAATLVRDLLNIDRLRHKSKIFTLSAGPNPTRLASVIKRPLLPSVHL